MGQNLSFCRTIANDGLGMKLPFALRRSVSKQLANLGRVRSGSCRYQAAIEDISNLGTQFASSDTSVVTPIHKNAPILVRLLNELTALSAC